MSNDASLLNSFRNAKFNGGNISEEHREYELCKIFGWTPEQIDNMDEGKIRLYREFYQEELRVANIVKHREDQQRKFRSK